MSYMDTVNRILEADYDGATEEEKLESVKEVITVCAVAAAAVTVQPLPLVDIALVTPIQVLMVRAIGRIHGYSLDRKAVLEYFTAFGASLGVQAAILAGAKFIPIAGWVMAIAMSYALTYAVGEVSDHYFKNGRGVSDEQLRERFEKVYKEKKEEKIKEHKKNRTLKEKLQQLKKAKEAGILTEQEFEDKKQDLMSNF